jgi:nucleotide-binding universal stress UspA family protein
MAEYRILIPLDGSRYAEHSLAYLPVLMHLGRLHVSLLSVVDETEDIHRLTGEAASREHNVFSTYLREIANDIERHLGVDADIEVNQGVPAEVIVERASELAPDLLVISTHGRSGVARWRRGSVADKVIRGAGCPVLVLGPRAMAHEQWLEAELVPAFRRILLPLDGSALAEQALPVAGFIARHFDCQVHLIRAVPVPLIGEAFGSEAPYSGSAIEGLVKDASAYLSKTQERLHPPICTFTKVRVGAPAAVLEEYIDAHDIDLVVMTSHGRGGLARLALGSVTDRLLDTGAPVMVVTPVERAD